MVVRLKRWQQDKGNNSKAKKTATRQERQWQGQEDGSEAKKMTVRLRR